MLPGGEDVAAQSDVPPIDVLVVVALEDELDAVLSECGGPDTWQEVRERDDLRYRVRAITSAKGRRLGLAVAQTSAMGGVATASLASALIERLQPSCVAMCGICAGKPGDVGLGDVIVASSVYSFDQGKLVANPETGEHTLFHDIDNYDLERAWKLDASAFRRDLGWATDLVAQRPTQRPTQERWLLHAIHAHEQDDAPPPRDQPGRNAMFRAPTGNTDWTACVDALRTKQWLVPAPGPLKLTDAGRSAVADDRERYLDGLPQDPPFRVHVGPIASGNNVIEDPKVFDRVKRLRRKTLGLEMEAYAIGYVGDALPHRAIVVKAVSDHADGNKDDRFRQFACRASAAWLFAFLGRHLEPRDLVPPVSDDRDAGLPSPFPDHDARSPGTDLDADDLHRRVLLALELRTPEAHLAWKRGPDDAPPALRRFLEVRTAGRFPTIYPVAVVNGAVTATVLNDFLDVVVRRYRVSAPHILAGIVHTSTVTPEIDREARRWRIQVESLSELQGLLDFRPYIAAQTRRLTDDPFYASKMYVAQRIAWGVGQDECEKLDALDVLDDWLGLDGPQLLLLLGDFGAGKTFLSRELALRLGRRDGAIIPVLIELRKLQKVRTLEELVGQHLTPERGMSRFDHGKFDYMLDEGLIVLIFDGFDELALRVNYKAAAEHLDTVLQAASGKAKVVITSRSQHFLNDQQVIQALGKRVLQRGFRMVRLLPFEDQQVRQFLNNRFEDDEVAGRWYGLLTKIQGLLGLSHNPRMLSFISELREQDLQDAAQQGAITSANLYRVLLERWLCYEEKRDSPRGGDSGMSIEQRWKAVTELAVLLWPRTERSIAVSDIPHWILDEVEKLAVPPLGREAVAFRVGSGTLLTRDEKGRFSFIHQSILEWLVANAAAEELRRKSDAGLLAMAEISELMIDFLLALTDRPVALTWALETLRNPTGEVEQANAHRVLKRLAPEAAERLAGRTGGLASQQVIDLSGRDLRGQDFSNTSHLRGAILERSNLSEASLVGANLSNARLQGAQLRHANLEGAILRGADLRDADLSGARLLGADLRSTKLEGASLRRSKLVGAQLDSSALAVTDMFGAAPCRPLQFGLSNIPLVRCNVAAWSVDGGLLAIGCFHRIVIADPLTGRPLRSIETESGDTHAIAFSRNGRILASGSNDHAIRLWDPETGSLLRSLEGHTGAVTSVAFSLDGNVLASGAHDGTIRLWNPDTGQAIGIVGNHAAAVKCIAFSPTQGTLASGSVDRTVRVWNLATRKLIYSREGHLGTVNGIAFSPDGRLASCANETVRMWSESGGFLRSYERYTQTIGSIAFSSVGDMLASLSWEGDIWLWNVRTGVQLPTIPCCPARGNVAFSPDGSMLASVNANGVDLWRPDTGTQIRRLGGQFDSVSCVAFTSDGQLVSFTRERAIQLWSPVTGQLDRSTAGPFRTAAFSRSGQLFAAAPRDHAGNDQRIQVRSVRYGDVKMSLAGHADGVNTMAFSPDGLLAASGYKEGTVRTFALSTNGTMLSTFRGHTGPVETIAFSYDSKLLASGSSDHTIQLWRPPQNRPLHAPLVHGAPVCALAFSPTDQTLASGSADRTVRIWNLQTGALRYSIGGHGDAVRSVAYSRNGELVASGSFRRIQLWRASTGQPVRSLDGHSEMVNSIAFSADGELMATGADDGTIRLWSITAALRGASNPCLAVIVLARGAPEGRMVFAPDGRYKLFGDTAALPGFTMGLCHFDPGELDTYAGAFDHPPRRVADDEPLFAPKSAPPP